MTSAEAKLCVGLPVRITAHQAFAHYATGKLISVEGDSAIVRGRFSKAGREETEQRFNVRYVRRWPAGEAAQAARLNTLAVASAAAELQGMELSKAAGLPVKKPRGVVPCDKFYAKADELGAEALMGPHGGNINVKFRNGAILPAEPAFRLTHPDVCPTHGLDVPCSACASTPAAAPSGPGNASQEETRPGTPPAAPDAPAAAESPAPDEAAAPVDKVEECPDAEIVPLGDAARHLVVDARSGRIWGGGTYGFMDAVQDPTAAIRYARGLHAVDARKYVSLLRNQNKRPGQYWRDGLRVMTEAEALELLTEPRRVFTPPPAPLGEQTGDAQEFGRAMAELASEMQAAAARVTAAENEAAACEQEARDAEARAESARRNAEAAKRDAQAAREAAGLVKARMQALIDAQGF